MPLYREINRMIDPSIKRPAEQRGAPVGRLKPSSGSRLREENLLPASLIAISRRPGVPGSLARGGVSGIGYHTRQLFSGIIG